MFENFLGNLKQKFQDHLNRKEEEKREMEKMQREIDFERKRVFQDEFKKNALKIAVGQAKKDAANKSGLQKLRSLNRLRRLNEPNATDPGNFFANFSAYTQRNLAKREENLKRTQAMREEAKRIREEDMKKRMEQRQNRTPSMVR
ncbi:hypothetical protein LCGC14_2732930 [marine sediment metagenome]|uniref:Trichohyalin-plectin-homology domain-containing protein n=1 Tax=marine sediment metagenome TaxID=412755 RepID=A0A0F8Z6U2_9ZZZZ